MTRQLARSVRLFHRDDSGAVVVDFLPVFFFLIILVLFIFEIGIAYFLNLRALKAAQIGARFAAVTKAVHSGVPDTNVRVNALGRLGEPCYNPNGADRCTVPSGSPWVCAGSSLGSDCDSTLFNLIVTDMQRTFPDLTASAVTITYVYRRLGETGGPFVPEVNVTIEPHEYEFAVFNFSGAPSSSPTRYGGVSASAFGENTSLLSEPVTNEQPNS